MTMSKKHVKLLFRELELLNKVDLGQTQEGEPDDDEDVEYEGEPEEIPQKIPNVTLMGFDSNLPDFNP